MYAILIFKLIPSGNRLNKFLRAGINPHLNSTHITYRNQVKRSFLLEKLSSYHLNPWDVRWGRENPTQAAWLPEVLNNILLQIHTPSLAQFPKIIEVKRVFFANSTEESDVYRKLWVQEYDWNKTQGRWAVKLIGRRDVRRMTKIKSIKVRQETVCERESSSGSLGYRQTHAGATSSFILSLSWPTGAEQEGMRALSHVQWTWHVLKILWQMKIHCRAKGY